MNNKKKSIRITMKKFSIIFSVFLFLFLFTPDSLGGVQAAGTGKIKKIKMDTSSRTLEKGKKVKLAVTFSPKNVKREKLIWSSSNKRVAYVSASGTVLAKAYGTATITARVKGTNLKTSCKIKVKKVTKGDLAVTAIEKNDLVKKAVIQDKYHIVITVNSDDYAERLDEIVPVIKRKDIKCKYKTFYYENAGGDVYEYRIKVSYGSSVSRWYTVDFKMSYGDKKVLSIAEHSSIVTTEVDGERISLSMKNSFGTLGEFQSCFQPVLKSKYVKYTVTEDTRSGYENLVNPKHYILTLKDTRDKSVRYIYVDVHQNYDDCMVTGVTYAGDQIARTIIEPDPDNLEFRDCRYDRVLVYGEADSLEEVINDLDFTFSSDQVTDYNLAYVNEKIKVDMDELDGYGVLTIQTDHLTYQLKVYYYKES